MMYQRTRQQRLAVAAVLAERDRQAELYPGRTCAEIEDPLACFAVLGEEFGEVAREISKGMARGSTDPNLRTELVQLAAVALAWVEGIGARS